MTPSERVFVVVFANYDPAEVDSLWMTRDAAETRRSELGGMWEVDEMTLHGLTAALAQARAEERERCLAIVNDETMCSPQDIAAAIRARSDAAKGAT